jgi:uncharacterized protein (DUF1697 family)
MPRYAAFLRGVSPMNAKMPALKRCLEAAGLGDVRTIISSGNLVFTAPTASTKALERCVEAAFQDGLGRSFLTIVRTIEALRAILARDPYSGFRLPPQSKRIVTFLRKPVAASAFSLPIVSDGARILRIEGGEAFSAYAPNPRGPVFMRLIEKTFGEEVTTRTWETVQKVAR